MKRPFKEICVYCGQLADTTDHIPPRSFFPKPRPSNLETVPSCSKCNQTAGKDEEYFLATFMFSQAGISEVGKKLWQEKLHRTYLKNVGLKRKISQNLGIKNLFTPSGIYLGKKMTIKFDNERICKVVVKIVKGFYFSEFKEPMSYSQNIKCLYLQTPDHFNAAKDYIRILKNGSKIWPGIFQYKYNRTEDGDHGSIWLLRFFDHVNFMVVS